MPLAEGIENIFLIYYTHKRRQNKMANNELKTINQKQMTTNILDRIGEMKTDGLALPKNYNASNALNVAFLELVDMRVKGRPLLEVVSQKSVYQSLLNMVLQGLSPAKNQVYFIPYGNELQMQRSYFGTQAALKRLSGVKNIWAEVIRKGEKFEFENDQGRKRLTNHEQAFETLDNEIVGAYAVIDTKDEGQLLEVMTRKQIDASWSQAKTSSVHNKFGDQMAMRTVINRAAKNYINTSDDSDSLIHAINDTTENEYDEETRRKDVTEAPQDEKTENLLSEFKEKTKRKEPENEEVPPKSEDPSIEEQPFGNPESIEAEFEEVISNDEEVSEIENEPKEQEEVSETENDDEPKEIDWSNYTVDQIKQSLDNKDVKYKSNAKRDELIAVAEMTLNGSGIQDELF